MPVPLARLVLIASAVLLLGVSGWWVLVGPGDARADLVVEPADTPTTSTTTSTTTTAAPPAATTPTTVPPPGVPVGLSIPEIGVLAPVVPVGLEADGSMEVPGASEAGWYLHGPRPGAPDGTAVIAAHVDFGGERGVFYALRELQVGSEVLVADDTGATRRHVVVERYQVDKDELPIEQIFVAKGPPGLTLITCGGAFDRGASSYEDNIVVRTEPA